MIFDGEYGNSQNCGRRLTVTYEFTVGDEGYGVIARAVPQLVIV